jgi:hypothetical protein
MGALHARLGQCDLHRTAGMTVLCSRRQYRPQQLLQCPRAAGGPHSQLGSDAGSGAGLPTPRKFRQPRAEAEERHGVHRPADRLPGGGDAACRGRVSLNGLSLKRLDLVKLDVEGMEIDVLSGARDPRQAAADPVRGTSEGRSLDAAGPPDRPRLPRVRSRHQPYRHPCRGPDPAHGCRSLGPLPRPFT